MRPPERPERRGEGTEGTEGSGRAAGRRSIRSVSPATGLFGGLLFLACGGYVAAVALGRIPGEVNGPLWIVWVAAGVFALAGAALLYYGIRNHLHPELAKIPPDPARFAVLPWLLGCLIVTAFTAVGAWIAFGPGPREFSGGVSGVLGLIGIETSGRVGELEGRIAFGVGAVLVGLFAVYGWWYGIRRLLSEDGRVTLQDDGLQSEVEDSR